MFDFLDGFLDTLIDILLWIPRQIFSLIIDGLIIIIEAISLPEQFLLNPVFPSNVLYYMDLFQIGWGLTLIFASLTARFLLRRIPLIG